MRSFSATKGSFSAKPSYSRANSSAFVPDFRRSIFPHMSWAASVAWGEEEMA